MIICNLNRLQNKSKQLLQPHPPSVLVESIKISAKVLLSQLKACKSMHFYHSWMDVYTCAHVLYSEDLKYEFHILRHQLKRINMRLWGVLLRLGFLDVNNGRNNWFLSLNVMCVTGRLSLLTLLLKI